MRGRGSNRSASRIVCACALAATAALALSACGSGSSDATAGGVRVGTVPEKTVQLTPPNQGKKPAPPTCAKQVGGFLAALDTLRTNLVAGLSYEQYVGEVEVIRGAYNRVPVEKLALECLQAAGTPGEAGLNEYIEAGNTWSKCVETSGCEAATVEPALQSRWRQAAKQLAKAEAGLADLEKSPNAS
jgi:hypothetical protein